MAMINQTTRRITAALAIATAVIIGIYKWYSPTGNFGIYGNKVSTYITTEAGQNTEVNWLKAKGFNSYCGYGISTYVSSNPALVRSFNLKLRRAGITDIGYIYSSASFISTLKAFQAGCSNDSMKFSFCVAEVEPYNTGDYTGFYNSIRLVGNYCHANGMKHYIYSGWPTQKDCDSIVTYADRVYLHAYGVYSNYSNPGSWCYGYQKGRLTMLSNSMNTVYYNQPTKKFSYSLLVSNENPDPTKTQFGYKYFQTHTLKDINNSFTSYFNSNATTLIKSRIEIGNAQLFVENFAK